MKNVCTVPPSPLPSEAEWTSTTVRGANLVCARAPQSHCSCAPNWPACGTLSAWFGRPSSCSCPRPSQKQVLKPCREATSHFPPAPAEGAGLRGSASPLSPPVLALFVKVVFKQFRGTNFVPGSGCDQTVSKHPYPRDHPPLPKQPGTEWSNLE